MGNTYLCIILVYLACSFLTYGITFGYFQGKYPNQWTSFDKAFAFVYSLFGPLGLFLSFLLSDFVSYGLKWRSNSS